MSSELSRTRGGGDPSWDTVIVGAGAAGLIAAIRAAELGRRVLLLEKNRRPGVKILMSGGTRCNLTQSTDKRGILEAFGRRQGGFLQSALASLTPHDLVAMVEAEGVKTKIEATGKIFPESDRATDILDAFLHRLERTSAVVATDEPMLSCQRILATDDASPRFQIVTPRRQLTARSLLVTTGGQSYPGCGTTGDGYVWARALGHSVTPLRPALTPLLTDAPWVLELQGITLPDVRVEIVPREAAAELSAESKAYRRARLDERRGSLLFTHFGLSGPVALDVSRVVSGHDDPSSLILRLDSMPHLAEQELDALLQQGGAEMGRRPIVGCLADWVPRRVAEMLLKSQHIEADRRLAELTKSERMGVIQALKRSDIPLVGTRGYKKAEVTAGGVSLDEVDSRTMQSKRVPGLYFAGEVLDLDGPIGGYNFQAAFSTGWLAGRHV